MRTKLCDFAHGPTRVRRGGTCVNVCARGWGGDSTWHLLLGWIGSVAGPFSRQQLLVLTTNPTPREHQSLGDYNRGPWHNTQCPLPPSPIITVIILNYCNPPAHPLSQGHDLNHSEGNLKLTWEKHQKANFNFHSCALWKQEEVSRQLLTDKDSWYLVGLTCLCSLAVW